MGGPDKFNAMVALKGGLQRAQLLVNVLPQHRAILAGPFRVVAQVAAGPHVQQRFCSQWRRQGRSAVRGNGLGQLLGDNRFGEHRVDAGIQAGLPRSGVGIGGDGNDRYGRFRTFLFPAPESSGHFDPVDAGHAEVHMIMANRCCCAI